MNIKNTALSFFLLLSISMFSQKVVENKGFAKTEIKQTRISRISTNSTKSIFSQISEIYTTIRLV